jgi:integrase
LHLAEAGVSICNRNRIMTGLRFLFRVTLRRLDLAAEIYHIREPQKIPPETLGLLRQWWKARPSRYDAATPVAERLLFPGNRRGKPMTTRQLSRLFHEAADAAGIAVSGERLRNAANRLQLWMWPLCVLATKSGQEFEPMAMA